MSTYVTRVIEVNRPSITQSVFSLDDKILDDKTDMRDGDIINFMNDREFPYRRYDANTKTWIKEKTCEYKWILAKYYADNRLNNLSSNPTTVDTLKDGTPILEINEFCDNGGSIRDEYLSRLSDTNLTDRGIPGNITDEARELIHYDEPGWGWGYTYATLAELESLYHKEIEKFKSDVIETISKKKMKTLEEKIDKIYDKLFVNETKENVSKDSSLNDDSDEEIDNEYFEEDDEDDNWELNYLFEEKLWDINYLHGEIIKVYHTVEQIFGYVDSSNIRILYYFS